MKKHVCPHCGKESFTPIQKAMAGSMRSMGKPCQECGRRCCNGMGSIYFSTIVSTIVLVLAIVIYLNAQEKIVSTAIIAGLIVLRFVLVFLFDMFFGKLTVPIRKMD